MVFPPLDRLYSTASIIFLLFPDEEIAISKPSSSPRNSIIFEKDFSCPKSFAAALLSDDRDPSGITLNLCLLDL